MKKITKALLASTMMVSSLGLSTTASAETFNIVVSASPAGLDPHIITAFSSAMIIRGTVYEGLTKIDGNLNIVPALASKWTASSDGKAFTFHLHKNAKFHDGSPLEASDVVASMERVMSKTIASPLASRLASVEKITAKDKNTVVIQLKEPSAPFLAALASIAIVPAEYKNDKDTLQRAPMGTGPFKFKEWKPNGYVELARHSGYHVSGQPMVDGVRFNIVPESSTQQIGLASGQYNMMPNINAMTAQQLQGKSNVNVQSTLELAYSLIGMNTSKPPFDNPKVREALNYALDRNQIIQGALSGAGEVGGPVSPVLKTWAQPLSTYGCFKPSASKAKALLKEAGVKMPVKFTLMVLPRTDTKDMAQIAQAQLAKAGFEVKLEIPEIGKFVQNWKNSNFDAFVSLNSGSPEPDNHFYRTFKTGGSTNVFKYSNAQLDTLLEDGRRTLELPKRQQIYNKVQNILACQGPIAFMTYGQLYTATTKNVTGFKIQADRSMVSLSTTKFK